MSNLSFELPDHQTNVFIEMFRLFPHLLIESKDLVISAQNNNPNIYEYGYRKEGNKIILMGTRVCDLIYSYVIFYQDHLKKTIQNEKTQKTSFKSIGLMFDVSRNAVLKVNEVKLWFWRMALMGMNQAMLYTEDTFEIPGEPYFGYKRGRYSVAELKELDAYAARLDIELIPCIQTLGHLEQVLQWPTYNDIKDTSAILLANNEKTFSLIEKMIKTFREVFRSKRIHVGMDEAVGIGTGKYLDKNGYQPPFEILTAHLKSVVSLCEKYDFNPMIWSDMYYRIGSKTHDYYDLESEIPKEAIEGIPENLSMVYWDYYNADKDFYKKMIQSHKTMNKPILMASGVWTWQRFWTALQHTIQTVNPCVEACIEENIDEIFATLWGDDGSECTLQSAIPGMIHYAFKCRGQNNLSEMKSFFKCIFQGEWDIIALGDKFDCPDENYNFGSAPNLSKLLLWQDPILGHLEDGRKDQSLNGHYLKLFNQLKDSPLSHNAEILMHMAEVLSIKADLPHIMRQAVLKNDKAKIQELLKDLPKLLESIIRMQNYHRRMWHTTNKPNGFEIIDVRYGGLISRIETLMIRLISFLNGEDEMSDVKEEPLPWRDGWKTATNYRRAFSASVQTAGFNY